MKTSSRKRALYRAAQEDQLPREDMVGRLNRRMSGLRDASNGRARNWQTLLGSNKYKVGKANATLFYNEAPKSRGVVHGGDFCVRGPRASIDEMSATLKSKYNLRESYRLGFGEGDDKASTILNRVVTLAWGDDGRSKSFLSPIRGASKLS